MENSPSLLVKNRTWPMFASAVVALLLTFALTPAHSLARWIGFGVTALCVVMAVLALTMLAEPAHASSVDEQKQ